MRRFLAFPLLCFPPVLLALSCGGEPADEPAREAAAEASATLSDIPEAQAAYDESLDLWSTDWGAAVRKLHEAIQLDPDFLHGHALLSERYAWIYQQFDRADSVAQNALGFAERAMELDPEAEVSLSAMGAYRYRVQKDYSAALDLYTRGAELYPGNLVFVRMQAHVARRKGDWDGAMVFLNRAEEMQPSLPALQAMMENHRYNRRWAEAKAAAREYARRAPESTAGPSWLAWLEVYDRGDTGPLREFLASRPTGWVEARWSLEMLDRNYEAALAVMDSATAEWFADQYSIVPRSMYRGMTLNAMGSEAAAREAFQNALGVMVAMQPDLEDDPRLYVALGNIQAFLGMEEEAIQNATHAVDLMPPEKDALVGPYNEIGLAQVHATLGHAEEAVERLEYLLSIPSAVTLTWLESGPEWDNIRDHPSFQALLES